jgi:single-stranded-DNA-specific exonuclease
MGNARPNLLAQPVRIVGEVRTVGREGAHAQLRLIQGNSALRAVAWGQGAKLKQIDPNLDYSVVFIPQINEWNGRREVQLELKDIRPLPGNAQALPVVAGASVD